jgi:uncharacterized protein YijF (DUF1287 family)/L,D-peptidoglycan transpeptidase YkuD (ErfK/YbiS/YcfS/YnhG family)
MRILLPLLLGLARVVHAAPCGIPLADRGVFAELTCKVRIELPGWLGPGAPRVTLSTPESRAAGVDLVLLGGALLGFAPRSAGAVALATLGENDADRDGIPDALDFLIGAKKVALNGAAYREGYRVLRYPGGDVPREEGVCTDVVIRALRNAGLDLQKLVHEDIRRARQAYPMVKRPDSNIDHRRVRTLLPYFKRSWLALPADRGGGGVPLLPGDLLFLDTMGDPNPEHLGIVSDRIGRSGYPLVVNNWTVGYRESEMDLLGQVPITHRFRIRTRALPVPVAARGLEGVLARGGLRLGDEVRQALLVATPSAAANLGELRRYARGGASGWEPVGRPLPIRIGSAGLGRGRGFLAGTGLATLPEKREGDRRSPAGVFRLGIAFGPSARRPYAPGAWPWRRTDARDRLVDDPASPVYNTWQREPPAGRAAWRSAEDLSQYSLGLVVEHNTDPVKPGAGSAIFLHSTGSLRSPSVGCTVMAEPALRELLRWLKPIERPVLIQLPAIVID